MPRITAIPDRSQPAAANPAPGDGDTTVIEVARFRRRATQPRADELSDAGELDWHDEPTLITDAVAIDHVDATGSARVVVDDAARSPAPRSLAELFAEPPALPRAEAVPDASPTQRTRRKRQLMLVCTMLAGAWVTLRPAAAPPPLRTSRVVAVTPAAAQLPSTTRPPLERPAAIDVRSAAADLAAARYREALAQYVELTVRHPDQPVFAVITGILRSELQDRCSAGLEEGCL